MIYKTALCLTTLILCIPQPIQKYHFGNFVIWNVGQGAWSTFIGSDKCHHFDMGGERFLVKQVADRCRHKKNKLWITHQDWDHIKFARHFAKRVREFCIVAKGHTLVKSLKTLKKCSVESDQIRTLSFGVKDRGANAASHVFLIRDQVLITGDAPKVAERAWLKRLPKKVKILLLGHHGSNTSTSTQLLKRVSPDIAIASARKAKYGHPHPLVLQRLKKQKVPVLTTETFGNIHFVIR